MEIYKNAARMLFSNDEANIDLVCMQQWTEEQKHLIWLEYEKLMQGAPLRYTDDFILTEIDFKNTYFRLAWWDKDERPSFSSNVLRGGHVLGGVHSRKAYNEQLTKDVLTAFEKVIKQALDGAQS
jgi:hypothetical protein